MKANNKGFDQGVNAQAAADRERQVIVAADVTNEPNDKKQLKLMDQQAKKNVGRGRHIDTLSSDSSYFSEENVNWAEQQGLNPHIATGRIKHNDRVPECPRGRPPKGLTVKERMARKLRTLNGRATYAQRKWIVEPVLGFAAEACPGMPVRRGQGPFSPCARKTVQRQHHHRSPGAPDP